MKYESDNYLTELRSQLDDYLPNHLPDNAKLKLVNRVTSVYGTTNYGKAKGEPEFGMYDLNLRAITVLNAIGNSHLLGMNEVVIPHLVREYGVLRRLLELIMSEHKALKQFQDINPHLPTFKLKDANSALYVDLTQLTEQYGIECDVKELVAGMPTDEDEL